MHSTVRPLVRKLKRLSVELAQAASDVDQVLEIGGRLALLGAEITAACEREHVRAMEVPAA